MIKFKHCPLCEDKTIEVIPQRTTDRRDHFIYFCERCGEFILAFIDIDAISRLPIDDRVKISVFTRERTLLKLDPILISWEESHFPNLLSMTIREIIKRYPQKISERVDRALINISKLSKYTGESVVINLEKDYPLFFPDSKNLDSAGFILNILISEGLIEMPHHLQGNYTILAEGWNRIYELEKSLSPKSKQGFIAMSFHSSLDHIWQSGIARAIRDAGFEPHRVSESETNGKICDEIIVQIRKSKFIVADFTGQRNGVYFEAGYALGLGIPVIWTCKKEEVDADLLHFDTRQYNHISWENEEDLYKRLLNRIKVNIV